MTRRSCTSRAVTRRRWQWRLKAKSVPWPRVYASKQESDCSLLLSRAQTRHLIEVCCTNQTLTRVNLQHFNRSHYCNCNLCYGRLHTLHCHWCSDVQIFQRQTTSWTTAEQSGTADTDHKERSRRSVLTSSVACTRRLLAQTNRRLAHSVVKHKVRFWHQRQSLASWLHVQRHLQSAEPRKAYTVPRPCWATSWEESSCQLSSSSVDQVPAHSWSVRDWHSRQRLRRCDTDAANENDNTHKHLTVGRSSWTQTVLFVGIRLCKWTITLDRHRWSWWCDWSTWWRRIWCCVQSQVSWSNDRIQEAQSKSLRRNDTCQKCHQVSSLN